MNPQDSPTYIERARAGARVLEQILQRRGPESARGDVYILRSRLEQIVTSAPGGLFSRDDKAEIFEVCSRLNAVSELHCERVKLEDLPRLERHLRVFDKASDPVERLNLIEHLLRLGELTALHHMLDSERKQLIEAQLFRSIVNLNHKRETDNFRAVRSTSDGPYLVQGRSLRENGRERELTPRIFLRRLLDMIGIGDFDTQLIRVTITMYGALSSADADDIGGTLGALLSQASRTDKDWRLALPPLLERLRDHDVCLLIEDNTGDDLSRIAAFVQELQREVANPQRHMELMRDIGRGWHRTPTSHRLYIFILQYQETGNLEDVPEPIRLLRKADHRYQKRDIEGWYDTNQHLLTESWRNEEPSEVQAWVFARRASRDPDMVLKGLCGCCLVDIHKVAMLCRI